MLTTDQIKAIKATIQFAYNEVFETFQRLNKVPEVLYDLPQTYQILHDALAAVPDLEVYDLSGAPCCLVGILRNGDGPVIAYRTDMDALPIKDLTDTPWRSTISGNSHSCGHSTHMSVAVMIAKVLSARRDIWRGTLLIYGQASEEGGTPDLGSGAQIMLEKGLFEQLPRPDKILAIHCDPFRPAGTIKLRSGVAFAHTSFFDLIVRGRAAHGGMPFRGGVDTILMSARIVEALQHIISRELNPHAEPAVLSIGAIHAGEAPNAIPAEARIKGTIRCFGEPVYHKICAAIARTANGIAASMGMPEAEWPTLIRHRVYAPELVNDPTLGEHIAAIGHQVLPAGSVEISDQPEFYGEDFANFGLTPAKIPIFLTWVGSVDPARFGADGQPLAPLPPLHDGHYTPYWAPEAATDTMRTAALSQSCALMGLLC
jgi:amidohydrolase